MMPLNSCPVFRSLEAYLSIVLAVLLPLTTRAYIRPIDALLSQATEIDTACSWQNHIITRPAPALGFPVALCLQLLDTAPDWWLCCCFDTSILKFRVRVKTRVRAISCHIRVQVRSAQVQCTLRVCRATNKQHRAGLVREMLKPPALLVFKSDNFS